MNSNKNSGYLAISVEDFLLWILSRFKLSNALSNGNLFYVIMMDKMNP